MTAVARACDNYTRPRGVMGGPCLNCGQSQPAHVHRIVDDVKRERMKREAYLNGLPPESLLRDLRVRDLGWRKPHLFMWRGEWWMRWLCYLDSSPFYAVDRATRAVWSHNA